MRRAVPGLAFLVAVLLGSSGAFAARAQAPLAITFERDQNQGLNRPWLDPTCYDDDHIYEFRAAGWLAPGATWSHDSPLLVCNDKIVKATAWHDRRFDTLLALTDYGRHQVPERVTVEAWRGEGWQDVHRACNTDLGVLHVVLADEPEEGIRNPATWAITNAGDRSVYLELWGLLGEPPWQGGEGTYEGCLEPPPA